MSYSKIKKYSNTIQSVLKEFKAKWQPLTEILNFLLLFHDVVRLNKGTGMGKPVSKGEKSQRTVPCMFELGGRAWEEGQRHYLKIKQVAVALNTVPPYSIKAVFVCFVTKLF